jgi:putative transposase
LTTHRVFVLAHLVSAANYRHQVSAATNLDHMEQIMRNVCADFGCDLPDFAKSIGAPI